jgi:hypothetical protein
VRRRLVRSPRLPLLLALALLAACSPVPGADVATDALDVDVRLLAFPFPRTSPIVVGFETGSPTRRVELEAGAVVEVIHLGATYDLALGSGPGLFDGVAYVADLPDVQPGDTVGFRLRRPIEADTGVSNVFVPPAPAVTAPFDGDFFYYGTSVGVSWTPGVGDDVWARVQPVACAGADDDEVAFLAALFSLPTIAGDVDGSLDLDLGTVGDPGFPDCTFEVQVGYVREVVDLAPELAGADDVEVVGMAVPIEIDVLTAP